jgi:putative endonuclease
MAGFVYVLANKPYGTLYIGVTSNLPARIYAHHNGQGSAFTKKYKLTRLVLVAEFATVPEAIQRETSLKRWKRDWKIELIEKSNPQWNDLFETIV